MLKIKTLLGEEVYVSPAHIVRIGANHDTKSGCCVYIADGEILYCKESVKEMADYVTIAMRSQRGVVRTA